MILIIFPGVMEAMNLANHSHVAMFVPAFLISKDGTNGSKGAGTGSKAPKQV